MAEQKTNKELSDEERLRQMAAQMRAAEYKGLTEEEIQERERQKEVRRTRNIQILDDTFGIMEKGCYKKNGQDIRLPFSPEQMQEIQVFLPEDIDTLRAKAAGIDNTGITSGINPLTEPNPNAETSSVRNHVKDTEYQQHNKASLSAVKTRMLCFSHSGSILN